MIPGMISSEVGLSFFGLGLTPTKISLGSLIENGRKNFTLYFHEFIWPSLALGLIILAFFLIGFALSDSLDPRRHR
jgi:ABC-type dipeptide/oligopeptide/nickel transport system permease subunit